jgi:hypothetical protein
VLPSSTPDSPDFLDRPPAEVEQVVPAPTDTGGVEQHGPLRPAQHIDLGHVVPGGAQVGLGTAQVGVSATTATIRCSG